MRGAGVAARATDLDWMGGDANGNLGYGVWISGGDSSLEEAAGFRGDTPPIATGS